MTQKNFRVIIDYWATYGDLAKVLGVGPAAVKQMRRRDRIPSRYWLKIINAAEKKEFPEITLQRLAELAQERGCQ